jgi:hypothetical protein
VISGEVTLWERDGTREKKEAEHEGILVGMVKYSKDFYVCCVVYILWMPAVYLVSYPIL